MILQKLVIPAQAGIQAVHNQLKTLDSRFPGNDENWLSRTFYESIIVEFRSFLTG
jgi:hypothetical protein